MILLPPIHFSEEYDTTSVVTVLPGSDFSRIWEGSEREMGVSGDLTLSALTPYFLRKLQKLILLLVEASLWFIDFIHSRIHSFIKFM